MKRQPVQFFAYLLLSIVTFGIYPIYYYVKATELQLELLQDILQELKDDSRVLRSGVSGPFGRAERNLSALPAI